MTEKSDSAGTQYSETVSPKKKKALEQKEDSEHQIGPEREANQSEAARKAEDE